MRFHPYVVFFRLCGASGLGVFLGIVVVGLLNILTGSAFTRGSAWLIGMSLAAVMGMFVGLITAWLTRRWFLPSVPRRRLLFTLAGVSAMPLATALGEGHPNTTVGVPIVAVAVVLTVTLWVRGFRRETALARAMMYGYGRPIVRR